MAADLFPSKPKAHSDCLVFEDAPMGIQAAHAAGMQSVLIPDGNAVPADQTTLATQLLATLEDFRPEDFGLPPFTNQK